MASVYNPIWILFKFVCFRSGVITRRGRKRFRTTAAALRNLCMRRWLRYLSIPPDTAIDFIFSDQLHHAQAHGQDVCVEYDSEGNFLQSVTANGMGCAIANAVLPCIHVHQRDNDALRSVRNHQHWIIWIGFHGMSLELPVAIEFPCASFLSSFM